MVDFEECFKMQRMSIEEFFIHDNHITSQGFEQLLLCLKAYNKVRILNVSKNQIASDIRQFKAIQGFMNCNKVLEILDMSYCGLDEKAGELIGKGLRGNRNLQSLNLMGNKLRSSVIEIARSFLSNKKALCLKELNLAKCELNCSHVVGEFS